MGAVVLTPVGEGMTVISESLYYGNGLSSVQHWRLWFLVQILGD